MWLITPIGFFSIVQKPGNQQDDSLTLRSRVRGDLVALKRYLPGLGPIQENKHSEYRYRAVAPRVEVQSAMARMIDDLGYDNFKSEVAKQQGHQRAALYHQVWDVLYSLQTDPAFADKAVDVENYGGVVVSGEKVLLRAPAHLHGGYAWTFAKTKAKPGESPREAAVRAVREKTGYEANIRSDIPGEFNGSGSAACYYLMDANHPPVKPNWQTSGLRWASFDEARELIRQSPNSAGLARDMAVLEAAEKSLAKIPYKEHPNVQPEDWTDLQPMPARHTVLHPVRNYSADEMIKIRRGFLPTVMEQKWFLYFTGTRLKMHRSWSGILIFDVGFSFDADGGASLTDVVVNREPSNYSNTDEAEDLALVEGIIRFHLLEPLEEPEVDGMVKALAKAMQPKYLGSPDVVGKLVHEVFNAAIQTWSNDVSATNVDLAIDKLVVAFTEESAGFTRMPDWHTAEQMGSYVDAYLLGSQQSGALDDLIRRGMSAFVDKVREMLADFLDDPTSSWDEHANVQFKNLNQFVVTVLLGTNKVTSGEKTLGDFYWVPAAENFAEEQIILKLADDDGKLLLWGRQASHGWEFCAVKATVGTDCDEIPETIELLWVGTWRGALKQLDVHQWTQSRPLIVHPDFCKKVEKALKARKKKSLSIDWGSWKAALNGAINNL